MMLGKTQVRRRWGQQDDMVGWYHQLNGHEFEQALGDGKGKGSLEAAVYWAAESDMTEQLNSNNEK